MTIGGVTIVGGVMVGPRCSPSRVLVTSPLDAMAYLVGRAFLCLGVFPDSFAVAFSVSIKFVLWRVGELIAGGVASWGRGLTDRYCPDIVRD